MLETLLVINILCPKKCKYIQKLVQSCLQFPNFLMSARLQELVL